MTKIGMHTLLTPIVGTEDVAKEPRVFVRALIEPDKNGIWDVGDAIRIRMGGTSNSAICWVPKENVFDWQPHNFEKVRGE